MQQVLMSDASRADLPLCIAEVGLGATDLTIVCRDGEVRGHQAVLAWASATLRRWLMSNLVLEDGGKRKEEVTLFLPSVSTSAVSSLTSFLLTGALTMVASALTREEVEEAWELLRIDRITFKAAFEAGTLALKEGAVAARPPATSSLVTPFKKPPAPRPPGGPRHATPRKPVGRAPGPPGPLAMGPPRPPGLLAAPPLAASTPLAPRTSPRIPHNLLTNTNVSITREGGGALAGGAEDVEILEVGGGPGAGAPGGLGRTPQAAGRRSVTMVYSKARSAMKGGALRPRLSQRPGVFKRAKLPMAKKVMRRAAELVAGRGTAEEAVRKSARTLAAVQGTYDEEQLGVPSYVLNRRSGRKVERTNKIDAAKEKEIKDKMLSSKSPKLRIPIKKLVKTKGGVTLPISTPSPTHLPTSLPSTSLPSTSLPSTSPLPPPIQKHTVSITKAPSCPSPTPSTPLKLSVTPVKVDSKPTPLPKSTKKSTPKPILKVEAKPGAKQAPKPILKSTPTPPEVPALKSIMKNESKAAKPGPKPAMGMAAVKPKVRKNGGLSTTPTTAGARGLAKASPALAKAPSSMTKAPSSLAKTSAPPNTLRITKASETPPTSAPAPRTMTVSVTRAVEAGGEETPLRCYICQQTQDEEGRSLNMKNIFFVRSHLSKCLYSTGKLFQSIPPGRHNTDAQGRPVDELGTRTNCWYNCEVEGCWLAQKKGPAGQVCYKVYAIHMASQHGALEMVLLEEGEQARELVEQLMSGEEERRQGGGQPEVKVEAPQLPVVEEGEPFRPVARQAATTTLAALTAMLPTTQPAGASSKPQGGDLLATAVAALAAPPATAVAAPAAPPAAPPSLRITELLRCRFEGCSGPGGGGNPREMKLHYAGRHFAHCFPSDPSTRLPPGFDRVGNRAVCNKCTEISGKPVYVQGEENAVRGHLVVKHDSLGEVLLQATEVPEARQVISDLYPELLEWTAGP